MASQSTSAMFYNTASIPSPSNLKPNATAQSPPSSVLFGPKEESMRRRGGVKCTAAAFTVKLITPEGELSFECPEDKHILEGAEEQLGGLDLPYSCRAGSCLSCAGRLVKGSVDQGEQSFLDDEGSGWVLMCVAYPKADVTIETHKYWEVYLKTHVMKMLRVNKL